MIVLDTNQIDGSAVTGPIMAMLTKLAKATDHRLVISSITVEEYLTRYAQKLADLIRRRDDAVKELRRLATNRSRDPGVSVELAERSRLFIKSEIADREKLLRSLFVVVDLDGDSAREALRREARRVAPAASVAGRKSGGGRDAAIWLSVLRHASASRERVYFVSADEAAFHAPDLSGDMASFDIDVRIVRNVGDLLPHLCDDVSTKISAEALAKSKEVGDAVSEAFATAGFGPVLTRYVADLHRPPGRVSSFSTRTFPDPDIVDDPSVERLRAYRVGDNTWATFKASWRVSFIYELKYDSIDNAPADVEQKFRVRADVATNVLVLLGKGAQAAEVLDAGSPSNVQIDVLVP